MAAGRSSTNGPGTPRQPASRDREAAAAARAETARRERRRSRAQLVAAALVGLGLVAGAAFWAARGGGEAGTQPGNVAAAGGRGTEQAPPWPAPADVPARAEAAGLPLGAMGTAEHYHAHLDVLVNGEPVAVPANIGVDATSGAMSFLHTHTPDGIVHIEAGRPGQPFTLGQLFTQWNVRLSATQVGALKTTDGNRLTLYVNGKKVAGDPARHRLAARQQIALAYGPADRQVDVPGSYDFAPGE